MGAGPLIRILSVDNLSGAAYRLIQPEFRHILRLESPARIHELVAGGHFDVALLPVASLPYFRGNIVPLGPFGIACRGPVRSVQLFSGAPLADLLHDQRPIYATPKSRTSVNLFRMLCLQRHGVAPRLTTSHPRAAAQLLIGDAAFEYTHTHPRREHDIDLSGWWHEQTGLPFVFARWVACSSLSDGWRENVNGWLAACAECASTTAGRQKLTEARPSHGTATERETYYQRIQYRLEQDALAGLNQFLTMMKESQDDYTARIA